MVVPGVSIRDCYKKYEGKITEKMFCTGVPDGGKGPCLVSYQVGQRPFSGINKQ